MTQVSPVRLMVVRAMYLLMAVGIGLTIWPLIVSHSSELPRMTGVAFALLGTIGLLALLGLRYPLQINGHHVNPAFVQGQPTRLTWGDLASYQNW